MIPDPYYLPPCVVFFHIVPELLSKTHGKQQTFWVCCFWDYGLRVWLWSWGSMFLSSLLSFSLPHHLFWGEVRCHCITQLCGNTHVVRNWLVRPIANEELEPGDKHMRKLKRAFFSIVEPRDEWSSVSQLDCNLMRDPNPEPHS